MTQLEDFIGKYRNHPVLFIGTGFSLRYLKNSFSWDQLLKRIASDLKEGDEEFYLDLIAKHYKHKEQATDYTKVAEELGNLFEQDLDENRNGKFKEINDRYYTILKEKQLPISRMKIYISELLSDLDYRNEKNEEIEWLRRAKKNIASIITTNYDRLIEDIFNFEPVIGNNILFSNPYGSVYKIHGCVSEPQNIIITEEDYSRFQKKYELIRAQLLSIFIHNPIIFIGYGVRDPNIKQLLNTIFSYVDPNSEESQIIRDNFLLVEWKYNSQSQTISHSEIQLSDSTIRINKIETDDFINIYKAIHGLHLPISVMDIRKVEEIFKNIRLGKEEGINFSENNRTITVTLATSTEDLENHEKILAIGATENEKEVQYVYKDANRMMMDYFTLIEETDGTKLKIINELHIAKTQWFPIFAFSRICNTLDKAEELRLRQKEKLENEREKLKSKQYKKCHSNHQDIQSLLNDDTIAKTNKDNAIFCSVYQNKIELSDLKEYLNNSEEKQDTSFRKLLCLYDWLQYGVNE